MNENAMALFLEKLKSDAELLEKLRAAKDDDTFVAIAQAAGFTIDRTELFKHMQADGAALTEQELESISGGMMRADTGGSWQCRSSYDVTLCVTNQMCCKFSAADTCLC